ncbi:hypothetical protein [Nitrososphaera sp.]|uniref:hypothetical protein n=1 Tax=Nitrososphaera sp. TaxID=1971748 RepID=UPI0017D09A4D|nr:hypothetical protein [Nitrososphaera sp.]NWG37671.1 hypothetical protein [Nitrososphaera sp.]
MSSQDSAEIKVQINSISVVYKPQHLTSSFNYMSPNPPVPKPPEIDPSHVHLHVVPLVDELRDCVGGSILIRKDDVRRLNLMVGDTVTLKITKS